MNRFKKMSREQLVVLLSAHILRFPVVGVLLKHLTKFSGEVYGQKDNVVLLESIKKLLNGLRWKK